MWLDETVERAFVNKCSTEPSKESAIQGHVTFEKCFQGSDHDGGAV